MKIIKGFCVGFLTQSLFNSARGALVDASSAVDAGVSVDDCNVIDGDCVLRACVHTCAASDTVVCFDSRHDSTSKS